MVTALVIGIVVALLVAAAWWIAQPKLTEDVRDLEEPLPLFSSRVEDGSPAARQHPTIEPAEVAMLRRGAVAARPPALPPVAPPPPAGEPRANGGSAAVTAPGSRTLSPGPTEDGAAGGGGGGGSLTPTAPRDAIVPGLTPEAHRQLEGAVFTGEPIVPAPPLTVPSVVPVPAGTVQFLPGRLEVLQGRGVAGQELRFLRPEDPNELPAVTFGRGEGPLYRHVQLRAPTVSRLHARMVLQNGGTWTLENLSKTNPIVLNGLELANGAPPKPLADGDRIEMGEIVFRFRQR